MTAYLVDKNPLAQDLVTLVTIAPEKSFQAVLWDSPALNRRIAFLNVLLCAEQVYLVSDTAAPIGCVWFNPTCAGSHTGQIHFFLARQIPEEELIKLGFEICGQAFCRYKNIIALVPGLWQKARRILKALQFTEALYLEKSLLANGRLSALLIYKKEAPCADSQIQ